VQSGFGTGRRGGEGTGSAGDLVSGVIDLRTVSERAPLTVIVTSIGDRLPGRNVVCSVASERVCCWPPKPRGVHMQRMFVTLAAAVAALCVVTGPALGALPKKGAVYVGDIKSSPFEMHVSLGVTASGTKTRFTYLCGTGRAPTVVFGVPIDSTGHFAFTKKTGSVVVWKMVGRFTSPTTARVSLNSVACGGSKGSTTVKLK
jgi:hypothetical protein